MIMIKNFYAFILYVSYSGLNAINTIVTDMEYNIRIDRLPLGRGTDLGQFVYPDIALHISNYYIIIAMN